MGDSADLDTFRSALNRAYSSYGALILATIGPFLESHFPTTLIDLIAGYLKLSRLEFAHYSFTRPKQDTVAYRRPWEINYRRRFYGGHYLLSGGGETRIIPNLFYLNDLQTIAREMNDLGASRGVTPRNILRFINYRFSAALARPVVL